MVHKQSEQRHPFISLLLLLMLCLFGAIVFTFVSIALGYVIYQPDSLQSLFDGTADIGYQKLLMVLSTSVGLFAVPAMVFGYLETHNSYKYLKLNPPDPIWLVLLAVAVIICATPFVEWTTLENEKMKLPAFLQGIEAWMKNKEDQLAAVTKELLVMKSIPVLLVNLLVIAVMPAISEEFIFRGCIQRIFSRWTKNYHFGIWIAAIIFSAIHLQFYGFIPRMLLGALFGYLLVWTNSIWVPVAAHFYNNASAVIAAYSLQKEGKSLDSLTEPSAYKWYIVVLSVAITFLLLLLVKKGSSKTINSTYE